MEQITVIQNAYSAIDIEVIKASIVITYGGEEVPIDKFFLDRRTGDITFDQQWLSEQHATRPQIIDSYGEVAISISYRAMGGLTDSDPNRLELIRTSAGKFLPAKYSNAEYSIRADSRNAKGPGKKAQWKQERNRFGGKR